INDVELEECGRRCHYEEDDIEKGQSRLLESEDYEGDEEMSLGVEVSDVLCDAERAIFERSQLENANKQEAAALSYTNKKVTVSCCL
ncbi:hypothetical protein Tcan_02045, partial [Toxocara canis]